MLLDRDVFSGGPDALLETNVRLTMKDGEIVYSARPLLGIAAINPLEKLPPTAADDA